jgi:catechol 2,3-dioxygenase-like lactoylglutathione lyase family enzyme
MSRVQLSINVSDFDAAVAFYSRLFGVAPAKLRPGYANSAIDDPPLKLVLNSPGNGPGGTINHLGVEVGSADEVTQAGTRLEAEGLDTEPEPGAGPPKAKPLARPIPLSVAGVRWPEQSRHIADRTARGRSLAACGTREHHPAARTLSIMAATSSISRRSCSSACSASRRSVNNKAPSMIGRGL